MEFHEYIHKYILKMNLDIQSIPRFVINLKKRPDRLKLITEEVKILFEDPNFNLFEGFEHKKPMLGCAHSHIAIIKQAKELKYSNVLIMEDDCLFHAKNNTLKYVTEAFRMAPDDFDLLFGGVYQARNMVVINEFWQSIQSYSSTHFYIINEKAYDTIIKKYDDLQHIDRWYAASGLKSYCVRKMFASQRAGYSNNVDRDTDYTYMFKHYGLDVLK